MLKVVQVVSDTNIGGAGRYLLNYLKYYDRNRFAVTVVVPEGSQLSEFIRDYPEVALVEAPYMADRSYDKNCVKFLKEKWKEIKPDILHTHASLSARIAGKKAKIKNIVATRHCIEPPMSKVKQAIYGPLNNYLCDYYIAVSDAVAKNLKEGGILAHKIRTVYNGVEQLTSYPPEAIELERKRYNISEDEFVFGVFARLEPVKGHRYFLKAAREMKKAGHRAKFLIVGDGSLRKELEEKAKYYGIGDDVIFTGYVKDTALLLNATDVNVISSESEAMSLAILEAMSLGKPTIATIAGGNPEVVTDGENGYLVRGKDSTSLAAAMVRMTEDEEQYLKMSEQAKKDYTKKFRAEIMVRNLEELYEEVTKYVD